MLEKLSGFESSRQERRFCSCSLLNVISHGRVRDPFPVYTGHAPACLGLCLCPPDVGSVPVPADIPFIWTSGRLVAGGWTWSATGQPVQFTDWGRGQGGRPQPDNREGNEVCLAVLNRFYPGDGITWHDIACHHQKAFICE